MDNLKKTPLFNIHQNLHAGMAPFGDWLMPIQYSGILSEHKICRESAALFDICHMGEFYFRGDLQNSGIEDAFCFTLSKIIPGKCKYGMLLNDNGGIIDDLIVYRLSHDELMIVVNSATTEKDFRAIQSVLKDKNVLSDISRKTAKLDLQGPLSREILIDKVGISIKDIRFFNFKKMELLGEKTIISRTGYTGEIGYEIYIDSKKTEDLWNLILSDNRVQPAGLGARDILRLEMGYSLYGHDIDDSITPLEAGLDGFVDFSKNFRGREFLLKKKDSVLDKIKIAFKTSSRRSPRQGYKIFSKDIEIGEVTSGCFSPMLSLGIGLGYVKPEYSFIGEKLMINSGNIEIEAEISALPFYNNGSLRK